jgi:hypothetical protein
VIRRYERLSKYLGSDLNTPHDHPKSKAKLPMKGASLSVRNGDRDDSLPSLIGDLEGKCGEARSHFEGEQGSCLS